MKIYVASSWRNPWQPAVVRMLRELGHTVYDFREPKPGEKGFAWSEIDPDWKRWSPTAYRDALDHPLAWKGFASDMDALKDCDACVLVLPCGNSAHLELGYAIGAGKYTAVVFPHGFDIAPIGGHTVSSEECRACSPHPALERNSCLLPKKLHNIEPELMAKAADSILIGPEELRGWITMLALSPAHSKLDCGEGIALKIEPIDLEVDFEKGTFVGKVRSE